MKTFSILLFLFLSISSYSQVFILTDSVQFNSAQIWGVCAGDGDSLAVTTTFTPGSKPHIYLRKVNYTDISQQSAPKQLTFDTDFTSITNLTDHKMIVFNNEIYVAFSTQGDQDIYLFKTDMNGNRVGSIVTVVQGASTPTNDMILTTNNSTIFVMHFNPPGQHFVYSFDSNLNSTAAAFSTTTLFHNNIGGAAFANNQFYLFTGDIFGYNSNLTLTEWSSTWTPLTASPQTIASSVGGNGNWFATGVAYDSMNLRWYIGMNHIEASQSIGQEHIDLLAYDTAFNLIERIHVTDVNYTRPHLVLNNGFLYMTYDRPGNGVYLHKYLLEEVNGITESEVQPEFSIYPNPADDELFINRYEQSPETFIIYDLNGKKMKEFELNSGCSTLNISELNAGMYFMQTASGILKFIKR